MPTRDARDRRHAGDPAEIEDFEEIEGNDLAEKALELFDGLRPHANTIMLVAAAALAGLAGLLFVNSQSVATRSQGWDAYLAALSSGELQAFDEVVRRYPGTPAAEWARLILADIALTEGTELLFADKAKAPARLEAAVGGYTAILAGRPTGMLAERATFGLAKARESLGQLDEARRGYAAIASEFPDGAIAGLAAGHASELGREATRQWYDWFAAQAIAPPAPPSGTSAPVGARAAAEAATPRAAAPQSEQKPEQKSEPQKQE